MYLEDYAALERGEPEVHTLKDYGPTPPEIQAQIDAYLEEYAALERESELCP